MSFYKWLSEMKELSRYILSRCILLTCALLTSSLILLVWSDGYRVETDLLYAYANHMETMALIVLAAGGIGSALVEDTLNHTT